MPPRPNFRDLAYSEGPRLLEKPGPEARHPQAGLGSEPNEQGRVFKVLSASFPFLTALDWTAEQDQGGCS